MTLFLERRVPKGGGGGGHAGGGGRGGGGISSSRGSASSSDSSGSYGSSDSRASGFGFGDSKGSSSGLSGLTAGTKGSVRAIPGGAGISNVSTLSAGRFEGRSVGGGTRSGVVGSNVYGSGYAAGDATRGVAGRGFPFVFWPIVFGGAAGGLGYLAASELLNQSSPGTRDAIYHFVSDQETVDAMVPLLGKCSVTTPLTRVAFNNGNGDPRPEQIVLYYRASTAMLSNDGYNNTAALKDNATDVDTVAFQPQGDSATLYQCLNQTIADQIPLATVVDDSTMLLASSNLQLALLMFCLLAGYRAM
ncbi:hypothetical protein BKA62DRAFT_715679 [Auriculariales sp. MPI-PUGE-AT-0066]|nr:hypothetical protein BKA62DRAFT_715679 [Auriculariales sp. MPI-PUGE-AT-0066]